MTTNRKFTTLAETFNVDDVVDVPVNNPNIDKETRIVPLPNKPENSDIESDVAAVRETLYNLLKNGEDAFVDLKRIAVSEESPRSFEVLNSMLSNLSDIAVKLIEIHERKSKIIQKEQPTAINNGVVNNNSVFIGTTSDLQNTLLQLNNAQDEKNIT